MLLNGVSLGQQFIDEYGFLAWAVPYTPGTIEAKAYRNQSTTPVASKKIFTTGPPAALNCSIKDDVGAGGIVARGAGVALVQVEVVDAEGRPVPTASNVVEFKVIGEGADIKCWQRQPCVPYAGQGSEARDISGTRPRRGTIEGRVGRGYISNDQRELSWSHGQQRGARAAARGHSRCGTCQNLTSVYWSILSCSFLSFHECETIAQAMQD